jgi:hypothetical protein
LLSLMLNWWGVFNPSSMKSSIAYKFLSHWRCTLPGDRSCVRAAVSLDAC